MMPVAQGIEPGRPRNLVSSAVTREQIRTAVADLAAGDVAAAERFLPAVYDELRALAGGFLKRERKGHSLQPTALVHEAWMRLAGEADDAWADVAHFKAVAVRAMRRVLVDHARRRGSAKRGGDWQRVTLTGVGDPGAPGGGDASVDLLDLDRALEQLEARHERQARVVELRFLGGLTVPETAHVLGVEPRTVDSDWATARVFLGEALGSK
jgi:RNA polymerase sigma factor (TIGR02999 family)